MWIPLATLLALLPGAADPRSPIRFEDVTAWSGLPPMHGVALPTNHGAAVAWFDLEGDGFPDIILGDPSGPTLLFHNRGDGTGFDEATPPELAAVENVMAIDHLRVFPSGEPGDVAVRPGLVLVSDDPVRSARVVVLVLDDGRFRSIPVGGASPAVNLTSHGDIDGDGSQDLIVAQYACGAGRAAIPTVFRLDRFPAGFRDPGQPGFPAGGCWPVPFFTDYDDNGRPVPFIATDYGSADVTSYVLRGAEPVAIPPTYAMGVAVGDANGDGKLDYTISSMARDLCWWSGPAGFQLDVGPADTEWGADGTRFKWGTAYLDADSDGAEERWITAGPIQAPFNSPDSNARDIYVIGGVDQAAAVGVDTESTERTIALADFDRDGRMDALIGGDDHTFLYRNTSEVRGRYLALELPDEPGARFSITACGRTFLREWSGGVAAAASETRLQVGLGACDGPVTVTVRWPWRFTETLGPFAVDQTVVLAPPGEVVLSPMRATPGATITAHSTLRGAVTVDGKAVVGGKMTFTAPAAPGQYRIPITRDGETLDLAPRLEVAADARDLLTDPWPPLIGQAATLSISPAPVSVTASAGATLEEGVLTAQLREITLDVDGTPMALAAVPAFAGATVLHEQTERGFHITVAPVDGRGVALPPTQGELVVTTTGDGGEHTTVPLYPTGAPWRSGDVPGDTTSLRISDGTNVVDVSFDSGPGGVVDPGRSRLWAIQPYLRADGQDLVEIAAMLFDASGRLVVPGPELLPSGDGLTLADTEYRKTFDDFGVSVYVARLRAGRRTGSVTVRVGAVSTTVFVVPPDHVAPSVVAPDLRYADGEFVLIPRDTFGQRLGPGVQTEPAFVYDGFGVYRRQAAEGPLQVTLDGKVTLDYRDGAATAAWVVPEEATGCSAGGRAAPKVAFWLVAAVMVGFVMHRCRRIAR